MSKIDCRSFVKKSGLLAGAMVLPGHSAFSFPPAPKNKMPRWKGFNFLDFFSPHPENNRPGAKEDYFKWMADWGFNFVRLPIAYPRYVKFDRTKYITPRRIRKIDRKVIDRIENFVYLAHKYNLHVSLNLHRAPGFCINAGFHEPYNL